MATALSVFDFRDYKGYLQSALATLHLPSKRTRTALARAIRCQPAYLSRVFGGEAHLSTDQAFLASKYLEHSAEERRYFMHLVLRDRASSPEIQSYFHNELDAMLQQRLELKRRVPLRQPLGPEQQAIYYGSWIHCAVHMALSVPQLTQVHGIAGYLGARPETVRESLSFLCKIGLAEESKGSYRPTQQQVHLDSQAPLVTRHHANWRLMAVRQLETLRPENFHYSSVVSIGEKDVYGVQLVLTEAIERIRAIVRESPAEQVACYTLDFFTLRA